GLATILLSRLQPDGMITFGVYLVDIFCLGLKNTYCNADFTTLRYDSDVRPKVFEVQDVVECPVELAHHIIYGAIDYAAQFGFRPNRDFKLSQNVLEGRDNIGPFPEQIEFGKDGKPRYVSGPDDNVDYVMRQLEQTAGPG
ncbi:unnamed protein product, partial [marine sediment metagenome]